MKIIGCPLVSDAIPHVNPGTPRIWIKNGTESDMMLMKNIKKICRWDRIHFRENRCYIFLKLCPYWAGWIPLPKNEMEPIPSAEFFMFCNIIDSANLYPNPSCTRIHMTLWNRITYERHVFWCANPETMRSGISGLHCCACPNVTSPLPCAARTSNIVQLRDSPQLTIPTWSCCMLTILVMLLNSVSELNSHPNEKLG